MSKLTHEWTKDWHIDYVLNNIPSRLENDLRYAKERGLNFRETCLKDHSCITYLIDRVPMAIAICPSKDDPTLWVIFTKDALKIRFTTHRYVKKVIKNIIRDLGLIRVAVRKNNHVSLPWLESLGFKLQDYTFKGYLVLELK